MFRSSLIRRGLFLFVAVMGWSVFVAAQAQSPSATTPQEPFVADDRLEIPVIHNTLRVAEPNEIPVVIHGSGLKTIFTDQRIDGDDPYGMAGGEQTLELLHHGDGSAYVKIVPIRLGRLTIRFTAAFADGGVATQSVAVDVGPSRVPPAALGMFGNVLLPNALFIDRTDPAPSYLSAVAYYSGMKAPIIVPPQFLTFDGKTAGDPPVIQVDARTGKVRALRTGDALLETRFAGAVMHSCIQVRDAPYSADVSNRDKCKELRHLDQLASSSPLNQTWAADPGGSVSFFAPDINFFTDRLSVVAPDRPVGLGQHVQIPIRLSDDKVRSIVFRQWIYNNGFDIAVPAVVFDAHGASLSDGTLTPSLGGESGKFVEIVPLALGNLEVGIGVYFEDGGFAERFFRIKVVPSSKGLKQFRGYDPETLQLPAEPERRSSTQLIADLTYDGIQNAIRLSSLKGVKFSVQQANGAAVVEFDDKGWVRALHPGDAVIVADFDGVKWSYPIHVVEGHGAP
jgi:hypothetical protein